jgi:hypothetical protein
LLDRDESRTDLNPKKIGILEEITEIALDRLFNGGKSTPWNP